MTYAQIPGLSKAVSAAVYLGQALGLSATAPDILHHSNHISIHLRPYPVVARVRLDTQDPQSRARLFRELEICCHLRDHGAPTIVPTRDLDPGPHFRDDVGLTLWTFAEHRPAVEEDWRAAKSAYREVHRSMIEYSGSLPSFLESITECRELLLQKGRVPALPKTEVDFLRATSDRLMAMLDGMRFPTVPLHGDPHLGNVLMSQKGPMWGDFESACMGPLEWDLTCFPMSQDENWQVDAELLKVLRELRSLCVVVWCSMNAYRERAKQEAAAFHLSRLHESR